MRTVWTDHLLPYFVSTVLILINNNKKKEFTHSSIVQLSFVVASNCVKCIRETAQQVFTLFTVRAPPANVCLTDNQNFFFI